MLEIKNLYKSFGEKKVLEGISLKLEKSGLYVVTGKSGSGKTTLFNIILGLLPYDSGAVENGFERTRAVFQEDRLLEAKTPVENLIFVGTDKNEAEKLLISLGLEKELETPTVKLSGGQRRRVALARALITKPDLLLLDEPTNALDEATETLVARFIEDYAREHCVLMITHRPEKISYSKIINLTANTAVASPRPTNHCSTTA